MKKKLSLNEIFQGRIIRLGIKEIMPSAGWGKKLSTINIRLINRPFFSSLKNNSPTIAIITPHVVNQLCIMSEKLFRQILDNLLNNNIVFLVLSSSLDIPDFLKNPTANYNIPCAASKYDEHYLKSLLRELIREKYQENILVHGVILEVKGKGILITGASGIGKTTAALMLVAKDDYWVADDVAVVKRNKKGELIAGGHRKISRFIHVETTGIVPVVNLLKPDRIKVHTKLAAIIKIEKKSIRDIQMTKGETKILGIKLTCLHINIPSTSFLDKNLLKKSLRQISKDN
jgi:serine kinase of HPr protein (carbohydrate metabolism regulator)